MGASCKTSYPKLIITICLVFYILVITIKTIGSDFSMPGFTTGGSGLLGVKRTTKEKTMVTIAMILEKDCSFQFAHRPIREIPPKT